jgi:hypothetical protein
LRIFKRLKVLAEFRKSHLPFVTTLEDMDLMREIGLHQAEGEPLTLKLLFLKGIGSVATVQRRLTRLKRLGVVHQSKADHDKRLVKLTISPQVWRLFARMGRLMANTR